MECAQRFFNGGHPGINRGPLPHGTDIKKELMMIVNEQDQAYTKKEIEEIVKMVRLELYNNGRFCGARAIKEKLEDYYEINPLPSESTIGRILSHHGLTNGRTGYI
jgi:hypothetical protein